MALSRLFSGRRAWTPLETILDPRKFTYDHSGLVVTCLEGADLLAFVCDVYCVFDTFPSGILGLVWYLIKYIRLSMSKIENTLQKQLRMIRKYHNHNMQTNPRHCGEELQNHKNHKTNKVKQPVLSTR